MASLILKSPLAGWALPLEEVPDPVFAQRMAGDGIAIDPTGSVLHAPCDGRVFPIAGARHALILHTADGGQVLLHLGIDTVALAGDGFQTLVEAGEQVSSGQPLMRFDLDLIARRAPSAVTPILLPAGGRILRSNANRLLAVGDFLMEVDFSGMAEAAGQDAGGEAGIALRRSFVLPFEHGLHARPAAQLVATLRPYAAKVSLRARGNEANARSTIALMALGTQHGDTVVASAWGEDAEAALAAIAALLTAPTAPPAAALAAVPAGIATGPISGRIASRGLAIGPVSKLQVAVNDFAERADDPARESAALADAIAAVRARLRAMADAQQGAARAILEAHAELVLDPELAAEAQSRIDTGSSAAHAWRSAISAATRSLAKQEDARVQERVADLSDVEQQVLLALGGASPPLPAQLPDAAILVADDLLPSQLLGLDASRLGGIATARGGPTSHVAIIAASLGIPALVALGARVLELAEGRIVLLDAERGTLDPAPTAAEQQRFAASLAQRRGQDAADLAAARDPARTIDGVQVRVYANLGAVEEATPAVARGAEGCGLLRTEFLFLDRRSPPGEDEQLDQYRRIRDALSPRVLTIRTMDIGGDKPIPYLPLPAEENPALGLRGLRTSLWQPELLRTQLRAILRLGDARSCRILLPMVTDLGDLRAARALLRECADELGITELPPLGAMVETPASALLAAQLLQEADFLSIGSNDLSQYVLAMDRGHPALSARLDALHPAVLRLLASVAAAGHAAGREVAVCGGLASDPEAIALLVGLGVRELSAVPALVPRVKRIVRGLDAARCASLAKEAMDAVDAAEVRALVARAGNEPEAQP